MRPVLVAVTRGYSDAPKLAVDREGTLHVAYGESAAGPFEPSEVHYTRSRDGGRSFESARSLSRNASSTAYGAGFPSLSLDGAGNVYVTWEAHPERDRPRGVAFVMSRDAGATFASTTLVPGTGAAADGFNGSLQGLLMRKLAVNAAGGIAIVNSSCGTAPARG